MNKLLTDRVDRYFKLLSKIDTIAFDRYMGFIECAYLMDLLSAYEYEFLAHSAIEAYYK